MWKCQNLCLSVGFSLWWAQITENILIIVISFNSIISEFKVNTHSVAWSYTLHTLYSIHTLYTLYSIHTLYTLFMLMVGSRQVTDTYFNPLGKSGSVVFTVCMYEFTLHSDCGSKWDPSLTLHAHTRCCVCRRRIGWQVQDILYSAWLKLTRYFSVFQKPHNSHRKAVFMPRPATYSLQSTMAFHIAL